MVTTTRVDGPAGRNTGSGKTVSWPPSGPETDSCQNIGVALRAGSETPRILWAIRVRRSKENASRFGALCPVQEVPLAIRERTHYFRTGNHKAMRRLRGIRTDFRYLFWNVREIARAAHKAGGA
eukprot:6964988-Pyramimonas_sp.AAC.1